MIKTVKCVTEVTHEFEIDEYGPITHIRIKFSYLNRSFVGDELQNTPKKRTKKVEEFFVGTKYFKAQSKKHGDNPSWMLDIPRVQTCAALSEEFLAAYVAGNGMQFDFKLRAHKDNPIKLLKEGKYHLFGRDDTSHNHMVYDYNGKPVWQHYYYGLTYSRLQSREYDLKALGEHLKKYPSVVRVKIEAQRCYDEYDSPYKLVFWYKLSNSEFKKLADSGWLSDSVPDKIMKRLGIEKFRKEETEDELSEFEYVA